MSENQKLLGYTKSRGVKYILLHLKKYNFLMETFISKDITLFKKIGIFLDFLVCIPKYGVGINDYFQYNFYKRRAVDRSSFIVARNRRKIITICNGSIAQRDFDDKSRFNKKFNEYLGRDWLDFDECTLEEFKGFVEKHDTFVSKIKDGSGGNGIHLQSVNKDSIEQTYKETKKKHAIIEEVIVQHSEMSKFNPKSVNTIRVITVVTSEEVKIMNAVFRCGNGDGCTDNFHHFGLAALIDTESGIVVTPAIDKLNHKVYYHPRTGIQIIGFRIPCWKEIIETVKRAAMVRPDIRYVGWDMVILQDGRIAIIEGNCAADPDIIQMPDQIGKWPMYRDVISLF